MVKKRNQQTRSANFLVAIVAIIILIGILSFVKVPYTVKEEITKQKEYTEEVPYKIEVPYTLEETYYEQKPVRVEECKEEEFDYEIIHPGDIQHEGLVTGQIRKSEEYSELQFIEWRYWTGYYQTRPNGGKYYQSSIFCNLEDVSTHVELNVCFYYGDNLVECPYHFKRDLSRRFCEVFTGLIWVTTYDRKKDIRMIPTYIPSETVCKEVTKMANYGAPKKRMTTKIRSVTKYKNETKVKFITEEIETIRYRSLLSALFNKT